MSNATDYEFNKFIVEFGIPHIVVPIIQSDKSYYDTEYQFGILGWFEDCHGRKLISIPYGNQTLLIGRRYSEEPNQWVQMSKNSPMVFGGRITTAALNELKNFMKKENIKGKSYGFKAAVEKINYIKELIEKEKI